MFYGLLLQEMAQNVYQQMTVSLAAIFSTLQYFWHFEKSYFCLFNLTHSPPIQWLPLVRWWHWVAEIYSSSSSLAFALILLNFLPLTNLELTSPYTHIWIFIYLDYSIFPLLILRSKCTWVHEIGDMGQTLSSWSLKNSWVLCRISRISVILVISFTLISEFSSY